jgi:CxxC-x17-CxxC domain-containing protein
MKSYKNDNYKSDSRSDRGDRDRSRPTMHSAVCAECGNNCEVPFRPSSDKPVFCNDCFSAKRGGDSRDSRNSRDFRDSRGSERSDRRDFGRSNFGEKRMFEAVCDECGENCEVPFRPTSGKPVYCSECFDKVGGKSESRKSGPSNEQFEMLSNKLDKIIKLLTPASSVPAEVTAPVKIKEKTKAIKVEVAKPKKALAPKTEKVKKAPVKAKAKKKK